MSWNTSLVNTMVKFCATNKVGYPTIQELIYVQDVELS